MSTPPPILGILTAGGFGCRAEGDTLIVHPAEGITDRLRVMIRANKAELLAYLAANDPAPVVAHRLWLIHHPDTGWVSHSFCPPASLEQVRAWYPMALTIAPEVTDED